MGVSGLVRIINHSVDPACSSPTQGFPMFPENLGGHMPQAMSVWNWAGPSVLLLPLTSLLLHELLAPPGRWQTGDGLGQSKGRVLVAPIQGPIQAKSIQVFPAKLLLSCAGWQDRQTDRNQNPFYKGLGFGRPQLFLHNSAEKLPECALSCLSFQEEKRESRGPISGKDHAGSPQ